MQPRFTGPVQPPPLKPPLGRFFVGFFRPQRLTEKG
jgi:hypothetical protein